MRLELETRRFYLGRDYSEALEAFGALPVHLPLIPDREYICGIMNGLDGMLLPGSDSDVDPAYFDEEPHPMLNRVVPEKDLTDRLVLEEVEKRELPLFAICYGMQALNVSRGGSLIQDIGAQVKASIKHEQGLPLERNSHSIVVTENSILGSLADAEKIKVNSHHHQAIRMVGNELIATARADDGIVECIEDRRSGRFVIGVQWHPELNWRSDVLSTGLFRRFVSECVNFNAART